MRTSLSEYQLEIFRIFSGHPHGLAYEVLRRYKMPSINSFWARKEPWLKYDYQKHAFILTDEGRRVRDRALTGRGVDVLRKNPNLPISPTISQDLPIAVQKQAQRIIEEENERTTKSTRSNARNSVTELPIARKSASRSSRGAMGYRGRSGA